MKRKLYFYLYLCIALIALPVEIMAQNDLIPGDGNAIEIINQSEHNNGSFNGTVDGTTVTIQSITFANTTEGSFIFKNINTTELIIEEGANVIIEFVNGNRKNTISKITNNGKLFMKGETFLPEVDDQDVTNNAFLTDSTASIDVVEGNAHMIMGICEGSEVHNEEVAPVHGIIVTEAPVDQVTFIWQRKNVLWWNDLDTLYVPTMGSRIVNCYHEVERAGQYRFRAFVENEGVITSLISSTTTVGKTYDVILPETEGVTLDPEAGTYTVKEGENFKFHLSLDKEYSKSEPFVTTSKRDTLEADWDGYYTIKSITDSLTIFIDNIEPDIPSSNEGIATDDIIINSGQGQIEIYTPEATHLQILTFDGITRKNVRLSAGNHLITMPAGVYLLKMDRKTVKVMVK